MRDTGLKNPLLPGDAKIVLQIKKEPSQELFAKDAVLRTISYIYVSIAFKSTTKNVRKH